MRKILLLKNIYEIFKSIYLTNIKFRIGFIIFIIILFFGFIVSSFAPVDPTRWYTFPKDLPPSFEHPLGTTTMGRSVFWMLVESIKKSLIIAFTTAMIASHVGLFLGMIAGLKGGVVDKVLMMITDVFIVIPSLPVLILLVSLLKDYLNLYLLGALISIFSWPWPSRQIRGIVLSLRERGFMKTASLSGMPFFRIILLEIMPFVLGWHLINFTNTILYSISSEAGLAILGLSLLSDATLGVMIYWAHMQWYALMRGIWWWVVSPVVTLILIFTSLYLISIGLSEYLNPRLRQRGA
ncbi:MAG: ABC transporter permease [Thermoprotei archaeon]|nr:MAG: ABC transporter permease [Thermoprotei archaeon]